MSISPEPQPQPALLLLADGSPRNVFLVVGTAFVSIGALPVPGFFGLDVLLFWLAFRASYCSGNLLENLRMTRDRLDVTRMS
ncbi:MAG: DUF2244 domain-containing protein [Rhodospirillaceae bacterium]|nr:DUF2244 domain-containing protein [Rhodospirillaceae bacterium]